MGVIDQHGREQLSWGGFGFERVWSLHEPGDWLHPGEWLDPVDGPVEVLDEVWARATLEYDLERSGVDLDRLPEWLVELVREEAE